MENFKQNFMDFSNNINPLGLSENIKRDISENVGLCEHYPIKEHEEVINVISEFEDVPKDNIITGNGSSELIFRIVNCLKPKKALLVSPSASDYEKALDANGCAISYHRLLEKNQFTLDETIIFQLTPNIDICFICNPNNPTGQRAPKQLLLRIAKQCKENNIFLVVDEGFMDFVEQNELYTIKDILEDYPNVLLIKALSKTYAMCGIRFGYGICYSNDIIYKLKKSSPRFNISTLACVAVNSAFKEKDYMKNARLLIRQEYEFLREALENLGFVVFPSKANFMLFKSNQINIADKLKEKGFLIRRCEDFRGLGNTYFRIAIKDRESNKKLLEAISQVILN